MDGIFGGKNPVVNTRDFQWKTFTPMQKLLDAAKRLRIPHRLMISGAGHDAMSFAHICDTGMVFIPCAKGISHNKKEFATIESILDGAMVMYEHLKEEAL